MKHSLYIPLLALFLFCGVCPAQERIKLRGIVKDHFSGRPVSGAEVELLGKKLSTNSDADGKFKFEYEPVWLNQFQGDDGFRATYLPGKGLVFRNLTAGMVSIRLMNVSGKTATKSWDLSLQSGIWQLHPGELTAGVYVGTVKTRTGMESFRMAMVGGEAGHPASLPIRVGGSGVSGLSKAVAATMPVDSLRVIKSGYFQALTQVFSLVDTGLVVELKDTGSANANLSALVLSAGSLSPAFASDTTNYAVAVPASTRSMSVTPTAASAESAIKINGVAGTSDSASGPISLKLGSTLISIEVAAADGNSKRTYAINVSRIPSGMRQVTKGSFQRGSSGGNADELPVGDVTFTYGFWMDTTEVTQKSFRDLLGASPWTRMTGFGQGDEFPAWNVNWYDAVLFCNAKSKRDGLDTVYSYAGMAGTPGDSAVLSGLSIDFNKNGYRLPTEAEWEFVAKAGTATKYFWGDDTAQAVVKPYVWYEWNADSTLWTLPHAAGNGTQTVATRSANPWGFYDLAGNVFEWVNDLYMGSYATSPASNPVGTATSPYRVTRGGSWFQSALGIRPAFRLSLLPEKRSNKTGFRTVMVNEAPAAWNYDPSAYNAPPVFGTSSHAENYNYLIIGGRPVCCSSASGTLTQNVTDPENDPLTYAWVRESGCGTITSGANTNSIGIDFCTSSAGISAATFKLTVADDHGNVKVKRFNY